MVDGFEPGLVGSSLLSYSSLGLTPARVVGLELVESALSIPPCREQVLH